MTESEHRIARIGIRSPAKPKDRRAHADDLMKAWLSDKAEVTMRNYRFDLDDFRTFTEADSTSDAIADLLSLSHGEANRVALAYKAEMLHRPIWRSNKAREAGESPDRKGMASSTINRRLAALRSICSIARRFGHIDWMLEVDGVESMPLRDTDGIIREDYLKVLAFLKEESESEKERTRVRAVRDLCIVRFLMDHALRRAEIVALDWPEDVDMRGSWLMIKGKRRREKEKFPLSKASLGTLREWLKVRGRDEGPLFQSMSKNASHGQRLSLRGFNDLISKAGHRAGVGHIRPHGFRHSAITRALDMTGGDIRAVAAYSRHKNVSHVMIYDDRRKQKPRKLVEMVSEDD